MAFDLHHQLQERYARTQYTGEGGCCEVPLDGGFLADVVRDGVVYEIQMRALYKVRTKIAAVIENWPVVIIYPIARKTVIVYCEGEPPVERARRLSPKHGAPLDAFAEAVWLAKLLAHPNLSLEIVLVDVEDFRVRRAEENPSKRRRRRRRRPRGWTTINRRMTAMHGAIRLDTPGDGVRLLPEDLPRPFTSRLLSEATGLPRHRAWQITYTLRHIGALTPVRRTKEGVWYTCAGEAAGNHLPEAVVCQLTTTGGDCDRP